MLNYIDESILLFFNSLARESPFIDHLIVQITRLDLLKGGILVPLLWWCWFSESKNGTDNKRIIIVGVLATLTGLFLTRLLASTLPIRIRPMHELTLPFEMPYKMYKEALRGWSSFPSDHAALFFGLSTTIFLTHRSVGLFAFAYTLIMIMIPRLITGLHYPSDLLGGALLGSGFVCLAMSKRICAPISTYPLRLHATRPEWFYPLMFFISYQIITLFNDLRTIGDFFSYWIKSS